MEIIDSLQTCHFFGDWQYIKEDDTKIFVTFHRDGKYNYKGSKGYFKGSGRWRWLRGQFIWLTGKRKDNNPLLYPYMQGDLLQDFSLVEKDKGLTVFTRVSGKGC
ncbi:MAG: hypothetical protein CR966_00900 [Pseudomonadales bacterium]|nr:MAG: hypothetical protein CR966_00900 [Pseudomonadales bacterium]